MTREELIRLAKEAGIEFRRLPDSYCADLNMPKGTFCSLDDVNVESIERFAELVAAAERERCAKVCDIKKKEFAEAFKDMADESLGAGQCAAAIREMDDICERHKNGI